MTPGRQSSHRAAEAMRTATEREPAQRSEPHDRGEGARELMRAVLADAILCLRGRAGAAADRERLATDATNWMLSPARTWPFSFESVCDVLGLSPAYLRRVLLGPLAGSARAPSPPADTAAFEALLGRLSVLRQRGNRATRVTLKNTVRRRKYHAR